MAGIKAQDGGGLKEGGHCGARIEVQDFVPGKLWVVSQVFSKLH